jgi:hypothetical protein
MGAILAALRRAAGTSGSALATAAFAVLAWRHAYRRLTALRTILHRPHVLRDVFAERGLPL